MATFDAIVIGAGVAGLGVAMPLASKGSKVVVIDSYDPKLNGSDRFVPEAPASYKNAGILGLGAVGAESIKDYFATRTLALYREMGVPVRDDGAYTLASSTVHALASDVFLERVSADDFAALEPGAPPAPGNKGIFKFSSGSQAEPEATMKILLRAAETHANVELRLGAGVSGMAYDRTASQWTITTSRGAVKGAKLIIAAGPGSAVLLAKLRLRLHVTNVVGVMRQTAPMEKPWLNGTALGARSGVDFAVRDACCGLFCCKETLEVTSWFGENESWTTHLYMNSHGGRQYFGGPRIAIPDKYQLHHLDPALYKKQMDETIAYAKTLLSFPADTVFDRSWAGVMAFAADDDFPVIGQVPNVFDGSLFVSTAFASAGFREAFGAGEFLAEMIESGGTKVFDGSEDPGLKRYRVVLPVGRIKRM